MLAGGALLGLVQGDPEAWFSGRSEEFGLVSIGGSSWISDHIASVFEIEEAKRRSGTDHVEIVSDYPSEDEILALIEQRAAARKSKNYELADQIRLRLADMDIVLEDGAGGTTWRLEIQ